MDQHSFDALTRFVSGVSSRRGVLGGLAGSGLGLAARRLPDGAKAGKRQQPRRKAFGCVDVGKPCRGNARLCCSGICQGKKPKPGRRDRSRCVAHDSGICTPQQDSCGPGGSFVCDPEDKEPYFCVVTTGKAAFCGDFSDPPLGELCRSCRRDQDCEDEFGPGAACIVFQGDCPAFCTTTDGTTCVRAAPVP